MTGIITQKAKIPEGKVDGIMDGWAEGAAVGEPSNKKVEVIM